MKIFIAWSKGASKSIGLALKEWLLEINRAVFSPVISDENIAAGSVWHTALDRELKSADFGVLCVTEENLDSAWLCYESGVLAASTARNDKTNAAPHVAPIRFGNVNASRIAGPIQHFQSIPFEKGKMLSFVLQLNAYSRFTNPNAQNFLDEKDITENFERAYPALEESVRKILSKELPAAAQERKDELTEKLSGILERLERLSAGGGAVPESVSPIPQKAEAGEVSDQSDELDAALAEFQRYDSPDSALSRLGKLLAGKVRAEGLTDENRLLARQYRDLLQRSQTMTDAPAHLMASQRLLNALSALL